MYINGDMISTKVLFGFFAVSLMVSSCYTTRPLIDDDVYIVKNSSLPVGESLNDETSYNAYKYRQDRNMVSDDYYLNDRYYLYNMNYNALYYDCGCRHNYYGIYNGYGSSMWCDSWYYYDIGLNYAFGRYAFDPISGMYIYNPYYDPYGYYGSNYGYMGLWNSYPYLGQGSYYGNTYTPNVIQNYHSGPRGGLSGFSDPSRRNDPISVKKSMTGGNVITTSSFFTRVKKINEPVGSHANVPIDRVPSTGVRTERELNYKPTQARVGTSAQPANRPSSRPPDYQQNRPPSNRGGFESRTPSGGNSPRGTGNTGRSGGNHPTPSGRRN